MELICYMVVEIGLFELINTLKAQGSWLKCAKTCSDAYSSGLEMNVAVSVLLKRVVC